MATDNRTLLNGCESSGDSWSGDDAVADNTEAGNVYQGSVSQGCTLSNALEQMAVSTIGGTRDMSDATCWAVVKDSLVGSQAAGGYQVVLLQAGVYRIGFYVGGYDSLPMPLPFFFWSLRFDVSEASTFNTAGRLNAYAGSWAVFAPSTVTGIGYGTIHAAKAKSENVYMDGFYFIANGSYALTIDSGTAGTPDTWNDVVTDETTGGWGMISNLQGNKYDINASWKWGVPLNQDSYFDDSDFQVFIDANDVGAGNFIVGATCGTGTNSLKLTNGLFVNIGTASVWDLSDTDYNTIELESITWTGIGTFSSPSSGGTSRFCTNAVFSSCGQITHNGCDMSGIKVSGYEGTANTSAMIYNVNADPDGELDNAEFVKGTAATHAIEFGTTSPLTMTIRGMTATGYNASDTQNDSTFHVKRTSGTVTINVIGGTGNFSYRSDGATVNIVIDPVTTLVNVKDSLKANIQNARVLIETAATIASGEMFEAAVTSLTQSAGTATCTTTAVHGLTSGDKVVIRGAQPDGYNKVATVTVSSTTVFTYTVDSGLSSPATGTPVVSFVAVHGLTDASGNISASRTWGAAQDMKGWARKKNTSSPFYQEAQISYTVNVTSGNTINSVLQPDE